MFAAVQGKECRGHGTYAGLEVRTTYTPFLDPSDDLKAAARRIELAWEDLYTVRGRAAGQPSPSCAWNLADLVGAFTGLTHAPMGRIAMRTRRQEALLSSGAADDTRPRVSLQHTPLIAEGWRRGSASSKDRST